MSEQPGQDPAHDGDEAAHWTASAIDGRLPPGLLESIARQLGDEEAADEDGAGGADGEDEDGGGGQGNGGADGGGDSASAG
ncbi:hypothetical protein [Streptomyces sp. NPDC047123]|uniref:hypothetical protein n=1 Tax=Streptomyces sp. NPDC047123 TaxID=3155622 RepID=UPI0033FBB002